MVHQHSERELIGRITTSGVVTNYTGTGISSPNGITSGPDGALWFTNAGNNSIGRITISGTVTDYTGAGVDAPQEITAGPDGALWFTNILSNFIGRISTAGTVTNYTGTGISSPNGITSGPDGALWFTNAGNNSIGRITSGGTVTDYTGTGISNPDAITAGPDGALWFTNYLNDSIGRITTAGNVTNFTGPGISSPEGITAGPDGALWFTNAGNNSIGRITTAGNVTNFTGPGISLPSSITAGPDGALWFTNDANSSIGRITTAGTVTNYTGTGIDVPRGITAGPDGALWFTNASNNSIGRITTAGTVTNYTGTGISGPYGITAGPDGALWFANASNNSIGRITSPGTVTNYTGTGIDEPAAITAGSDGGLWFGNSNSIGRITPFGPPVSGVEFWGSSSSPQVVINGSGFGQAPPYPSYSPGCGGTGLTYGYYLYLRDSTANWNAGQDPVSGAANCVGLVVDSWSNSHIVFGFGDDYAENGWILSPGDTYYLHVFSTIVPGTVAYAPAAATQDAPSAVGNGTVTVNWTVPSSSGSSPITGYAVYDSTTAGGENTTGSPACTASGASATSCTASSLANGTTYDFEVVASNAAGASPPSNEESATPFTVPGAPIQDTPSGVGNGSVTVNWTGPSSNGGSPITGYAVYDSTTAGGENTTGSPACTASGAGATSCTVSAFSNGTYYFVVVASNGAGASASSNEESATPYAPLVSSVQLFKTDKNPLLVINGSGFGPTPPAPSYPPPTSGCAPNLTGSLYGTSFYFQDLTRSWTAGLGGPGGTGNCIGLMVTSWSDNQIVLGFGNAYNTNGWILTGGDNYSLSLYSTTSTGTSSYRHASVSLTPNSGAPKAAVTVSGNGFAAGETVTVGYSTGLTSPKTVTICKATADSEGTYSCDGRIPNASRAGANGTHTVSATGSLSKIKATTTFDLT